MIYIIQINGKNIAITKEDAKEIYETLGKELRKDVRLPLKRASDVQDDTKDYYELKSTVSNYGMEKQ